jgi:hypothetical protein
MCVLSLIYNYVAVCRSCAVRCLISICFCLLFSNYCTYFLLLFLCLFCFEFLFSILCIPCFSIVFVLLCVLFLLLCCPFPIFVQVYRPLPPGGNPTAVNKYVSYHISYHIPDIISYKHTIITPTKCTLLLLKAPDITICSLCHYILPLHVSIRVGHPQGAQRQCLAKVIINYNLLKLC